jgi:16S rRNA (cytosine967-C5)-methyltransferase
MSQAMSRTDKGRDGANSRAAAAIAVDCVLSRGMTLDNAFAETLPKAADSREIAEIRALAFGALRWHSRHRLIINTLLDKPLRARDAVLESLLSVGLYQLLHSRQPEYAVVSATVAAVRKLRRPQAAGLINAMLRRFGRERDAILADVMSVDEGRFAHPEWLITAFQNDWPDCYQDILASGLTKAPLWIRVNRQMMSRDDYRRELAQRDMPAFTLDGFADALRLEKPVNVTDLPGFAEGLASVQDAASQLACPMLAPQPGMRVLDACAAPGGKATHMLEYCAGDLDLVAVDVSEARLALVNDNLNRLHFHANLIVGDALDPASWFNDEPFDRILVDAPCSATGVIRRHPDIKFLRRSDDIAPMAARQSEMLARLWPLLKPGGRLLYSTCSVLKDENIRVVRAFLQRQPGARLVEPDANELPSTLRILENGGCQSLPGSAESDGLYYALMTKEP